MNRHVKSSTLGLPSAGHSSSFVALVTGEDGPGDLVMPEGWMRLPPIYAHDSAPIVRSSIVKGVTAVTGGSLARKISTVLLGTNGNCPLRADHRPCERRSTNETAPSDVDRAARAPRPLGRSR